jgi:hypothetical protein
MVSGAKARNLELGRAGLQHDSAIVSGAKARNLEASGGDETAISR